MAEEDLDLDVETEEGESGGGGKKWIIIGVIALVMILGGGAAAFFLMSGSEEMPPAEAVAAGGEEAAPGDAAAQASAAPAVTSGPMQYLPMEPAFVVNFSAEHDVRFMQITMQAGDRDGAALGRVKDNLPAIRNAVVMLLRGQNPEELNTREGTEKLRQDVVAETRTVLKELTGNGNLETIYFTSFVMQ